MSEMTLQGRIAENHKTAGRYIAQLQDLQKKMEEPAADRIMLAIRAYDTAAALMDTYQKKIDLETECYI